jgi:hypothetical protein
MHTFRAMGFKAELTGGAYAALSTPSIFRSLQSDLSGYLSPNIRLKVKFMKFIKVLREFLFPPGFFYRRYVRIRLPLARMEHLLARMRRPINHELLDALVDVTYRHRH